MVNIIKKMLINLKRQMNIKRPETESTSFILLQDNARPHLTIVNLKYLKKKKIILLGHAPYSPDLAPCDSRLFPKLKKEMRGRRFLDDNALKKCCDDVLRGLSENFFKNTFNELIRRWEFCVKAEGDYFIYKSKKK